MYQIFLLDCPTMRGNSYLCGTYKNEPKSATKWEFPRAFFEKKERKDPL